MTSNQTNCKICNIEATGKKLSNHIQKVHSLTSMQYTVDYLLNRQQPMCLECGNETRYSSFSFKKYCTLHSSLAESQGGRIGGHSSSWNKGKTKETDSRIAKVAESMCKSDNHFFGKKHTQGSRDKISLTKLLSNESLQSRLDRRDCDFILLTQLSQYHSRQNQYLEFKCTKCGNINKKTLQAFERGSLCVVCHPINVSQDQRSILNWIKTLELEAYESDRSVIAPRELDIIIPSHNLAIEFDGR